MSNHDKVNPVVEINLGTEKIKLTFSLWTLWQIEEKTGKNALDGATWLNPSAKELVTLIWAAWNATDPQITMEQVARKIDFGVIGDISDQLAKAFEVASGEPEKNGATPTATTAPAENADRPIGSNSGQSADSISA